MSAERATRAASDVFRNALFSECGAYRYRLLRVWGQGPGVTFVMLNPSTADGRSDDPTIRRCMAFARTWGRAGIRVVNLFALRSTDPAALRSHLSPVGARNNEFLCEAFNDARKEGDTIVAAWGPAPSARVLAAERAREVAALARGCGVALMCLGKSKSGAPRHPLMMSASATLQPWGGNGG